MRKVAMVVLVLMLCGIGVTSALAKSAKSVGSERKAIISAVSSYEFAKEKHRYTERFAFLKTYRNWVSIATCAIDENGKDKSDFISYLLKKTGKGWRVMTCSDECWISKKDCKRFGLSISVVRKLDWKQYE